MDRKRGATCTGRLERGLMTRSDWTAIGGRTPGGGRNAFPSATSPDYPRTLELYERLVATNPKIERKGDTMPYTSVNGNMFSPLTRSGTLALRLPQKEREAFLRTYSTELTEQYGIVMKEYVDVPDSLLADTLTDVRS